MRPIQVLKSPVISIVLSGILIAIAAYFVWTQPGKHEKTFQYVSDEVQSVAASVLGYQSGPTLDTVQVKVNGRDAEAVIFTTHFAWAPDRVGQAPIEGEGHAHVILDHGKLMTWGSALFKMHHLSLGTHVIEVELAENDHTPLLGQKKTVTFVVSN